MVFDDGAGGTSLDEWQMFAVFGDVERLVGVRLTDTCLMLPNKSVSGIRYATELAPPIRFYVRGEDSDSGVPLPEMPPLDVRAAVRDSERVLARGGGSKTAWSTVPDGASDVVVLDTQGLAGIVEYEPEEFTITALAGTVRASRRRSPV